MSSVGNRTRQVSTDSDYFISFGSLVGLIEGTPLGGPAMWASTFGGGDFSTNGCYASTLSSAGCLLKDMGKTVVSSGGFYRKVQLVVPQGAGGATHPRVAGLTSTFGVAGTASASGQPDFLTGYIKLGFDGQGVPAPVAKFGR